MYPEPCRHGHDSTECASLQDTKLMVRMIKSAREVYANSDTHVHGQSTIMADLIISVCHLDQDDDLQDDIADLIAS